MRPTLSLFALVVSMSLAATGLAATAVVAEPRTPFLADSSPKVYSDDRPAPRYRLDAVDPGPILRHGEGPDRCDINGMREASLFESDGTYYLYYDGCGPEGWLACLATSRDLKNWTRHGPKMTFGDPGEDDAGTATSPWFFQDGKTWHMFYVGCRTTTPPPNRIPVMPYYTLKAKADSPEGPWVKQKDVVPFRTVPGTYNAETASPGFIVRQGDEFLMFYSAADGPPVRRTLAIARTRDLDGPWQLAPEPLVPLEEQIENSSVYFEPENQTWFLFTNHIGIDEEGKEFTDAVWVYWSKDLERWNADHKAVVLDGRNCTWAKECLGMPTVLRVGDRLALLYDSPGGEKTSHMRRDIGLAWLNLPLIPPEK